MTVLIVEDEELAAAELKDILKELDASMELAGPVGTIDLAVKWLRANQPDLIFMDIHLGDGESFEIFKQVEVSCPVVFTTAFDQYTLKAFKNQGIDYILKPFEKSDIQQALDKIRKIGGAAGVVPPETTKPRSRFMVNLGNKIKSISAREIAYFMAEGKHLYVFTHSAESYIIDETITSLEPQLSPKDFFRVNRKFIIHIEAIRDMFRLSRNRIKVLLEPAVPDDAAVVVSEDRAEAFRAWLNS